MSGYGGMFAGLEMAWRLMVITLCISVPLGLWKLVEIVIWLFKHIDISFV